MLEILFGSLDAPESATFASDYPLSESVQRLFAAVVPPGFDAESGESAMGVVTQDHVRLEHNQPWPCNNLRRPCFIGSFRQEEQGVILSGRFVEGKRMVFWPIHLDPIWSALAALPLTVILAWRNPANAWWGPPAVSVGFAVSVATEKRRRQSFRNDVKWLSAVVEQALTAPPGREPPSAPSPL